MTKAYCDKCGIEIDRELYEIDLPIFPGWERFQLCGKCARETSQSLLKRRAFIQEQSSEQEIIKLNGGKK